MIPAASITAWAHGAPWPSRDQIEQDLVLSRLICEVASHPMLGDELVFRGGTCLHKLHLPQSLRYSEDLDYVRVTHGPIGPLLDALREVAALVGLDRVSILDKADGELVLPASVARSELTKILAAFRDRGAAAGPVLFGNQRKPTSATATSPCTASSFNSAPTALSRYCSSWPLKRELAPTCTSSAPNASSACPNRSSQTWIASARSASPNERGAEADEPPGRVAEGRADLRNRPLPSPARPAENPRDPAKQPDTG